MNINAENLDPVPAVLHDLHFTNAGEGHAECLQPGCGEIVEVGPRLPGLSDDARLVYARRHREVCRLK
ncbi:hypothetical protein A5761_04400 [Mycolicibacterium setense]|uniref:hypothetical protein n=1 Tax=Mycolicibacterium setense TaxID=431269 RepID=UPI0007EA3A9A|nr:hypothetical protein [Mycolicibacterium setense]OBB20749.1 hypothetical protein A5761_04400 [Mycolicibacterium setense]